MKSLIFALRFLTVIPFSFRHDTEKNIISDSMLFFPVIGLLIGIILASICSLLNNLVPDLLLSIIIILILVIITGGLHLDGLADTIDGFYAGNNKESILRIMRDSHIGTMGVLALITVILLKIGFLLSLTGDIRLKTLIIMPVISRWSIFMTIFFFKYARSEGKAESFFVNLKWIKLLIATAITLGIVYFMFELKGILLLSVIVVVALIGGIMTTKKIGGVTGDTLGALCEINEVSVLLLSYIINGVFF